MNMISYKKGDIEIIDQSTFSLFEERYAGLGALIGPHFYRRNPRVIPPIKNAHLFPHIERLVKTGIEDPFSHGIGRYAPWKTTVFNNTIHATLSGKDEWNGVPLSELEGQNFTMNFDVELTAKGLKIELSVVSDFDSLVGIHYYYALPNGSGTVTSDVKNLMYDKLEMKSIPASWPYDEQHILTFDLSESADFAFHPFYDSRSGKIVLDTGAYCLQTIYESSNEENSWQLYHPKGASYVCIEPVSSQNPRRTNLTVSSIKIFLEIL
jgi:hypothetical protein